MAAGVLMAGYSALLGLGLLLSAPWWLARMATTERYREGLGERLGRVPRRLREAVAGRRVVWVHAVSVGEVLAVSWLVSELEAALGTGALGAGALGSEKSSPGSTLADGKTVGEGGAPRDTAGEGGVPWVVVISTTTRTGQALARERFGADRVFYFPLDLAVAVRAYLRLLKPALLVLAESELWPRMLHECERTKVPVAVVNARVSDRSFRRALRVRRVWGRMLRNVSLSLAQSEEDARRLVELGASRSAVQVSGNLKYDIRAPKQSRIAELIRRAIAGRQVIVAGSTVKGEDELVIAAFHEIRHAFPGSVLIIAPRHPERFAAVVHAAEDFGAVRATHLTAENASKILAQTSRRDERGSYLESRTTVLVLDTIGDLSAVYQLANVAFVGGSLIAHGGHNPLEPAQFGVPVVMGSSFENFREVVYAMQAVDGIEIVQGIPQDRSEAGFRRSLDRDTPHASRDGLATACIALLRNRDDASAMGERGREVFVREQGATARSVAGLLPLIRREVGVSEKQAAIA